VAEVHDRMPFILEAKDFEQWGLGDTKDAAALMNTGRGRVAEVDGFEAGEQLTGDLISKTIVSRRKRTMNYQRVSSEFPTNSQGRLYVSGLRARPWN
jgi:hypothetical protein